MSFTNRQVKKYQISSGFVVFLLVVVGCGVYAANHKEDSPHHKPKIKQQSDN